jgi:trans-aconitate methyltransferase
MSAWRLFDGDTAYVSTYEFHADRPRGPHLEQDYHSPRLHTAAGMIRSLAGPQRSYTDLGCGDGGLLSLCQDAFEQAWGYDFQPSNAAGWAERGVTAEQLDVFGKDWSAVSLGTVVSATEVLEHLTDPHGALRKIRGSLSVQYLVCSSPVNENAGYHDPCHAWAWDSDGYEALVSGAGFRIREHQVVGPFQVVMAEVLP